MRSCNRGSKARADQGAASLADGGRMATDLVGSSGSNITRIRFSLSGGSPGASAVITASMLVG